MRKTPIEIRIEARQPATAYALEREAFGDPDGAECMHDLANMIHSIEIERPDAREPSLQERPY